MLKGPVRLTAVLLLAASILYLAVPLFTVVAADQPVTTFDYFGSAPPGDMAEILAPGFASTEYHDDMYPMISPDGNEVILRINGRRDGQVHSVLYLTHRSEAGAWSSPRPLPFLTDHRCGGAQFSPDGSHLYFTTKRPLPGADPEVSKSSLWFATRTRGGWSVAQPVVTPLNRFNLNGGSCIAADGTMYAALDIPGGDSRDIYVLECTDGEYPAYSLLPGEVNTSAHEVAPYVNSNEGYLLVTVVTPDGLRIGLSIRDNAGAWTKHETLEELTAPEAKFVTVSPDGKYVMFVSHRKSAHSNPQATWDITDFDAPPMEDSADIYWMKADFLKARVAAMKAMYGILD